MSVPDHRTHPQPVGQPDDSIGSVLTHARTGLGISQLDLAERLCRSAETVTLTRTEISRWERECRIPSRRWLRHLASVLGLPLPLLEHAATQTRAAARQSDNRGSLALLRPGHTPWGIPVDQPSPLLRASALGLLTRSASPAPGCAPASPLHPVTGDPATIRSGSLALRHLDDLVGGADLAHLADLALSRVLADLTAHGVGPVGGVGSDLPPSATEPDLMSAVAELAQVTCWINADAGRLSEALSHGRTSLRAAARARNHVLTSHVLGCLAEIRAEHGQTAESLRLARAAVRMGTTPGPVRAIALHRLAYVTALSGDRNTAETALLAAEQAEHDRHTTAVPQWLYWLDEAHLAALTGRCYAALGRPRQARAVLADALSCGSLPLRARSLCQAWLARAMAAADVPRPPHRLGVIRTLTQRAATGAIATGSHRVAHLLRQVGGTRVPQDRAPSDESGAGFPALRGYLPDARTSHWVTAGDAPSGCPAHTG